MNAPQIPFRAAEIRSYCPTCGEDASHQCQVCGGPTCDIHRHPVSKHCYSCESHYQELASRLEKKSIPFINYFITFLFSLLVAAYFIAVLTVYNLSSFYLISVIAFVVFFPVWTVLYHLFSFRTKFHNRLRQRVNKTSPKKFAIIRELFEQENQTATAALLLSFLVFVPLVPFVGFIVGVIALVTNNSRQYDPVLKRTNRVLGLAALIMSLINSLVQIAMLVAFIFSLVSSALNGTANFLGGLFNAIF